jgi:AraC-like DNA-binding protein
MVEEKLPVNLAASESGFINLAHFNKMFRRIFNLSPTEYLRAHDLNLKSIKEYSEVGIIAKND